VNGRYVYLGDLQKLDACRAPDEVPQWGVGPSPFRLAHWEGVLKAHPDQQFAAYIRAGLSQGFRVGFDRQGPELKSACGNHPSASVKQQVVSEYIADEVQAGRLVGPVSPVVSPVIMVSPIGLVPKAHQVDKWRMIVDLSHPLGHSVNAGISEELASLSYARVDDAVQIIQHLGMGTQLIKVDLKSAYRHVPVHPQDQHLLGISWLGKIYVDRALPFRLRSAPKIFSAVVDMMVWALHCAGIKHMIHYLDDFLFFVMPGTSQGASILSLVLQVFDSLGVPVAAHKTEGPATAVTFLGILIDTQSGQLRLPPEKLTSPRLD